METLLWIGLALVTGFILLLLMAADEPVFAISAGSPAWFVALRLPQTREPTLAPGVRQRWRSDADFALIGADDPYWSRFLILSGGGPEDLPLALDGVEDAYIARVRLRAPPKLALGLLRLLVVLGILNKPRGEIMHDASHTGFRADAMPSASAIATLLAKPASYAPAMVNFLRYGVAANYPPTRPPSTGRAAYRRYGMVAMRTVYRTGGRLLFYGAVEQVLRAASAGPTRGDWHDVAAMRYPSPPALLSMEHVPAYRAALIHRDAGLDRTVVIASTPTSSATGR